MAACTQGFSPITLQRREFVRVLGFFRGNVTHFMLRRHMIRNEYPFKKRKKTGSIEFVATAPDFRNQGLGFGLLTYIMEENPYDAYVLEVADTNEHAVKLYDKLGFKEIKRMPAPKKSGVNFFVYKRKEMGSP
jgi:ribosomal protein S18 acetylase RimI-like enzyme